MMVITIHVELPAKDAQGLKEALAMDCEKYGRGVRVVEVREVKERQESLWTMSK